MKRKKVVKQRGSKTHGYGSKKKHRGAGSRGGRGMAGGGKQKKFWMIKNMPGHIGRRGFKTLRERKVSAGKPKAINLRDIEMLAAGAKELDISKLGYGKVLSAGTISGPVTIKAESFSKAAKEKIEKAGGKAVVAGES